MNDKFDIEAAELRHKNVVVFFDCVTRAKVTKKKQRLECCCFLHDARSSSNNNNNKQMQLPQIEIITNLTTSKYN